MATAPSAARMFPEEDRSMTVVRYGPFVMNTEGEIRQAIEDYRQGRMDRVG